MKFGDVEIRMQLDAGADVTIISTKTWVKIGSPRLDKATTKIGAANGTEIQVLGEFQTKFSCAGFTGNGRCFVAKNTTQLLGIEWMDQLPPMIKAFDAICCSVAEKPSQEETSLAVRLQTEFPNVFKEELGHCSKKKARLLLKSESQPKFCRP